MNTENKCYLIALKIQGKNYIELTKQGNDLALSAYETKKEVLDKFSNFKDKAKSSSYESHISGSLGILNLCPHAIEVPRDNPEVLKAYIKNEKPLHLQGSLFGAFINFDGLEVNDEIFELSVCDVAKEIINEVYS